MRILLLTLLLPLAAPAASVYKWTDQNGVVHYTDRPLGPEDRKAVPGVESADPAAAAPRQESLEAPRIPTEAELQGIWCEFELRTEDPEAAPTPEKIQWTFTGDTLEYRNLELAITLRGDYEIVDGSIAVDNPAIGRHRVRSFFLNALELAREKVWYRLRRGRC